MDNRRESITDHFLMAPPLQEALVIRRTKGHVSTNVPHRYVHHSPTGYEYGYGGSGPADLALNLAEAVILREIPDVDTNQVELWDGSTCSYEAWIIHHDLKFGLIAPLSQDTDYTIPYEDVEATVMSLIGDHQERIQEHHETERFIREEL